MFELEYLKKQIDSIKNIHCYDPETFFVFGGAISLGTTTIRRKFDKYKTEMIKKYPTINDTVTIHGIRHSVGTDIANTYKSVTLAKEQLGHFSLQVTSRYVHTDSDPEVTDKRSKLLHAKRTD